MLRCREKRTVCSPTVRQFAATFYSKPIIFSVLSARSSPKLRVNLTKFANAEFSIIKQQKHIHCIPPLLLYDFHHCDLLHVERRTCAYMTRSLSTNRIVITYVHAKFNKFNGIDGRTAYASLLLSMTNIWRTACYSRIEN